MTNQHPITPPPELVQQWADMLSHRSDHDVFSFAARWGADQELQACINFVYDNELCDPDFYNNLRNARRPKPPSLKEQALSLIPNVCGLPMMRTYSPDELLILRRALEALPND
jgi:hypothetical protein